MTSNPPRRQAAIKADELNRAELERGVQEEEGEEEDSDYVSDDENERTTGSSRKRRKLGGIESDDGHTLTEMAKRKAAELFSKLGPQISQTARKAVDVLLKEDRDEEPENSMKKRKRIDSFDDPMLKAYLAQPQAAPSEEAIEIAQTVLRAFGTTTVQEKVKFAGQEVEVSKKVDKARLLQEQEAQKSSLDTYIEGITKKQGITTVEKSSYDWEKYKEEKNLAEELQDAHKAGFVEKQAFLKRVDEKQFEIERAARERERARREASQPQKPAMD